ncbi:hypothetical protein [Glycomyces xiaoerkulensis]|uniref:hypothetical protein n=1 Tax=Glycomyces xiaoerkulensis TaxID=2038139 RepID=UPI000C2643F1|nr:hypothetical protein [Glycomyces xiaoerkulensis]
MILLCRFHDGRIHTGQWAVVKTGPGKATIRHTDGAADTDWDLSQDETPTGLYPDEWSPKYRRQLNDLAAEHAMEAADAAIARTRAAFRAEAGREEGTSAAPDTEPRPTPEESDSTPVGAGATLPPPIKGEGPSADDWIPF